jgi:hypothetical protein
LHFIISCYFGKKYLQNKDHIMSATVISDLFCVHVGDTQQSWYLGFERQSCTNDTAPPRWLVQYIESDRATFMDDVRRISPTFDDGLSRFGIQGPSTGTVYTNQWRQALIQAVSIERFLSAYGPFSAKLYRLPPLEALLRYAEQHDFALTSQLTDWQDPAFQAHYQQTQLVCQQSDLFTPVVSPFPGRSQLHYVDRVTAQTADDVLQLCTIHARVRPYFSYLTGAYRFYGLPDYSSWMIEQLKRQSVPHPDQFELTA